MNLVNQLHAWIATASSWVPLTSWTVAAGVLAWLAALVVAGIAGLSERAWAERFVSLTSPITIGGPVALAARMMTTTEVCMEREPRGLMGSYCERYSEFPQARWRPEFDGHVATLVLWLLPLVLPVWVATLFGRNPQPPWLAGFLAYPAVGLLLGIEALLKAISVDDLLAAGSGTVKVIAIAAVVGAVMWCSVFVARRGTMSEAAATDEPSDSDAGEGAVLVMKSSDATRSVAAAGDAAPTPDTGVDHERE